MRKSLLGPDTLPAKLQTLHLPGLVMQLIYSLTER
ncbi:unannotated protein [freshwater metagenome]|uniref:Unannotated protein n=1 Tax=freshwater metagenome TaxID=449393 RepID=A0A6J6ZPT7_9ZZZZ